MIPQYNCSIGQDCVLTEKCVATGPCHKVYCSWSLNAEGLNDVMCICAVFVQMLRFTRILKSKMLLFVVDGWHFSICALKVITHVWTVDYQVKCVALWVWANYYRALWTDYISKFTFVYTHVLTGLYVLELEMML